MADLSSGCDFCGVKLCFDARELRIERHRKNAALQTLYAQPGCALLRPLSYVTLTVVLHEDNLSLTLSGVNIVSSLAVTRTR
eukprot:CAMPEP_0176122190 /NCGR_PEP_ID=MMETSP0120_2-20121206/61534_1 /TAXON_ID=160619 /ORGANISM="Kryptoperidinium foliaceum, Strain CCMP 1326" /LENGTH=81 /DNA_ID=CAMNT_0017456801 /DNA_START=45 /DNA_END=287 /DNA_ORIENTATION=+